MTPGKIIGTVIGAIAAIAAIGLVMAGAFTIWAFGTQRDADGFIDSPTYDLATTGYAIVSEDVDLGSGPNEWFPSGFADVRFDVEAEGGDAVFVGIGPSTDVAGYLGGVARSEVTRFGDQADDVDLAELPGTAPASPPGTQGFWAASNEGPGLQQVAWDVEQGEWTVVIMNADASQGVAVGAEGAIKISALLAIGIGILLFGLVMGALAAALLVWATRPTRAAAPIERAPVPAGTYGPYPVLLEGDIDPGLTRWMWLVKWLLAIPHFIVLAFLTVAFVVMTAVAFFAILFTGRYPKSIFDFNVGVMRWMWRVEFYTFAAAATDQYPPFTLDDVEYPARLDVAYPERLSRGLPLVKLILAIPHLLIVGVFTSGVIWWTMDTGDGNLALMECLDAATGNPRYVICAVGRDDGDYVFTPFGHLADGRRQTASTVIGNRIVETAVTCNDQKIEHTALGDRVTDLNGRHR